MARIKKVKDSWHRIVIETDRKDGEVLLVRGGRRAYLWAGKTTVDKSGCVTVSGTVTLRKLAKAILAEIPKE
jgi:hypothetical protein